MAKYVPALMLIVCLASASALHAQEMVKPLGKWERKVGKTHVTISIESTRLHILCTGDKAITLHADYAMTRDGLVYGVVTSIECDEEEEADMTQTLFDAPFSFRFRIDEGALIIHDMKAADADSKDDMWNGRYKSGSTATTRDGIVPTSYAVPVSTSFPFPTPPSTPRNNPPSHGQTGGQEFNYFMGFGR